MIPTHSTEATDGFSARSDGISISLIWIDIYCPRNYGRKYRHRDKEER
jgi:hypothetical protein